MDGGSQEGRVIVRGELGARLKEGEREVVDEHYGVASLAWDGNKGFAKVVA